MTSVALQLQETRDCRHLLKTTTGSNACGFFVGPCKVESSWRTASRPWFDMNTGTSQLSHDTPLGGPIGHSRPSSIPRLNSIDLPIGGVVVRPFILNKERIMTATASTPVQPAYKIVPMSHDFDSLLAAMATIACKGTPEEVKKLAVAKQLLPEHGPYWAGDDMLIAKIFVQLGFVSTVWKEASSFSELPSLALVLDDYDEDTDLGRFVVYHRRLVSPPSTRQEEAVLLDPAYWLTPEQRVRRDFTNFQTPIWFIGVSQMGKVVAK